MVKTVIKTTLAFLGVATFVSCGPMLKNLEVQNEDSKVEKSATPSESDEGMVKISVGLEEKKSLSIVSFYLASATSYSMSLEGCVSGLSYPTITNANPSIDVYKFDQGCIVKLNNFVFNGITWVPSAGDPFSSWVTGDSAIFEDQLDPANTMSVVVNSQLDDPVSGTESVEYFFSEIVAGADQAIAKNIVGDAHALSVNGFAAPSFTIDAVSFTGMTAAGAGQFVFTLECSEAVTGSGATEACAGLLLDDVTYKLVPDTYGGVLTIADAIALFPSGESVVGGKLLAGEGGTINGGFTTVSGAGVLISPDEMHNNPNMILILEAANTSYLYFNVDVTTLTYP